LGKGSSDRTQDEVANLLVLKAGEKQFGLVVDTVNDTQEIVVKPIGKHFKGLSVFAGATIMGDGRVALILDVYGLAQHAHVVSGASESQSSDSNSASSAAKIGDVGARQSILIFSLGTEHRLALPLSSVGRLEKFSSSVVEREGPREVVQYRGQIMPLINLSEVLGIRGSKRDSEELSVVVYRSSDRNLGLVVGQIEDIIDESITLQNQKQRVGILGSAVIQGHVTEMLDIPAIVNAARL
jgi:two-component system chemotaxis sensor kinase CheA